MHEFERRQRADVEQAATRGTLLQCRAPLLRWQRHRPALRDQNITQDRDELVLPALERVGVALAELGERRNRALDIGPPFERTAVARQQRNVELRLDVV